METTRKTARTETVFDLLTLDGDAIPTGVELCYDTRDPYAVTMILSLPGQDLVTWTVCRDLLTEGMVVNAGVGDLRLWPQGTGVTLLELCSPDGYAMLRMPNADLDAFLASTRRLVPPGHENERLDIDHAVLLLLNSDQETRDHQ